MRSLERVWIKAFKPFGLTPSQAFMLRVVFAKPALLQNELAKELAISPPTATRTLDGLQKLELVERRSTESNGGEYAIYPTALAQSIGDSLNAASATVSKFLKQELGDSNSNEIVLKIRKARCIPE